MNFEDEIAEFSEEYRRQKAPAGAQAAALIAWAKSHSRRGFSLLSVPVVSAVAVLVIAAVVVPFLLEPAASTTPPALSLNQFSTPEQPSVPSFAILPMSMSMSMPSLPADVELTIPRLNQISTPRIQTKEMI